MLDWSKDVLGKVETVDEMVSAFSDEERCRRLLEALIWPCGRCCPKCGYRRSSALADRTMGEHRSRPGLYQCSSGACRFQFSVTTRTPLHSTKLPLSTWMKGLWFILQSDKGVSSIRLAEALGVSQPTAWRMGHVLRLLVMQGEQLCGVVEADEFHFGQRISAGPAPRPVEGAKDCRAPRRRLRWSWLNAPKAKSRARRLAGSSQKWWKTYH